MGGSLTTSEPRQTIEDVFIFVRDEMQLDIEPVETGGDGQGEPAAGLDTALPQAVQNAQQEDKPSDVAGKQAAPASQPPSGAEKSKSRSGESAKSSASASVRCRRSVSTS